MCFFFLSVNMYWCIVSFGLSWNKDVIPFIYSWILLFYYLWKVNSLDYRDHKQLSHFNLNLNSMYLLFFFLVILKNFLSTPSFTGPCWIPGALQTPLSGSSLWQQESRGEGSLQAQVIWAVRKHHSKFTVFSCARKVNRVLYKNWRRMTHYSGNDSNEITSHLRFKYEGMDTFFLWELCKTYYVCF